MAAPLLVTGATGNVGRPLVEALLAAGAEVRGASRHGEPVGDAEAVRYDVTDAATWAAAYAGVETMFFLRPPQVADVKRQLAPALLAAQRAGVRHVVLLSLQGADRVPVTPHARLEAWLRTSGLSWTFVRPSFFVQNLSTTHAAEIRDAGEIRVPAGNGRTAFVDAVDVAAVAAVALLEPDAHAGRAWTPTGPEALTYAEVADVLSDVLGRRIRYTRPGLARYLVGTARRGTMPLGMAVVTGAIYTTARLGLAAGLTEDVRRVTGRAPHGLRTAAERERGAWA